MLKFLLITFQEIIVKVCQLNHEVQLIIPSHFFTSFVILCLLATSSGESYSLIEPVSEQ